MGPNAKKRKLQGSNSENPAKRAKDGIKPSKKPKKSAPERRAVEVSALPWQKDPDGFMGLEVLEGVDVVRQGEKVEFILPGSVSSGKQEESTEQAFDDEFEGFDDSPAADGTGGEDLDTPLKDSKVSEDKTKEEAKSKDIKNTDKNTDKKKDKPEGNGKTTADDAALADSNFAALADMDDTPDTETDISEWKSLNLSPEILSAISNLKFPKPTAIQSAAIPEILAGHDVIGKASTGSGKTLAFAIPIVEKWLAEQDANKGGEEEESSEDGAIKTPLSLILSPTRELAHQLVNHIKGLCDGLAKSPYVCSITGGLSVQKQQRQLAKADIVIGTPGRLWEVLSSDIPLLQSFKKIKFLVVDEADRLLSEGHFAEAEEILDALDREELDEGYEVADDETQASRQTLVFSATFNKSLQQKLAGKGKYNLMSDEQSMEYLLKKLNFREEKPKFLDVNPISQMAEGLKEGLVECGAMEKDLFLYAVLMLNPASRTLVFTNSIASVRRLTPMLTTLTLKAHALHSQMPQKARLRSIERFAASKPSEPTILIATDVAARGLDIPNVDQVIHYHVPRAADAYVHRSGRTARGSNSGVSILLCAPDEVTPARRMVAKVHAKKAAQKRYLMRTVDLNRKVVSRLKPRLTLAKQIADAQLAKERTTRDDDWVKAAAEELGVDYEEEDLEWGGRGSERKKKEKEASRLSKAEIGALKAQMREMLAKRVNTGVSEKYITGGGLDIHALLKGEQQGEFLGRVDGLLGAEE